MSDPLYDLESGPPDEDDPVFEEETFQMMQALAWKPEDLRDPVDRQKYEQWLARQGGNPPSND